MRRKVTRLAVLSLALWSAGCQSPRTAVVSNSPVVVVSERLTPGDVVRVSFTGARQHDVTQRIRPDGKISLPLVGEVTASGKTVGGLQAELGRLYASQLQDNEVVVILDSSAAAVYVNGAVNRPGKVILDRPMTAFEAIMEAGGFDPGLANLKKVRLVRNENGRQQSQTLDLSPVLNGKASTAFFLKPYDVLYVQERFF